MARHRANGTRFLVLANNPIYTPRDLAARPRTSGIDVPEERIWTSALATARFLADQRAGRIVDSIADLLPELDR